MGAASVADAAVSQSAMRKASWRIIPLLGLGYLFSSLDRLNISFAAAQMNLDLGFSATVYGFGAGFFFLTYALLEVPSGMVMPRVGARRWIARIMISWGLVSSAMMFIKTPWQFYALRLLLGAAEAGFWPTAIYVVSSWFPGAHRGRALSRFYAFGGVASIVMGALSGWLLALDGTAGLHSWQWLFLVEGLPTILVGLAVLKFLPDDPAHCRLADARGEGLAGRRARRRRCSPRRDEWSSCVALLARSAGPATRGDQHAGDRQPAANLRQFRADRGGQDAGGDDHRLSGA